MRDGIPYPWIEFSLSVGTWDLLDNAYPAILIPRVSHLYNRLGSRINSGT
jgi:hypothetical protein